MTTNDTDTTDVPAWVGLAAGLGIILFAVGMFGFDRPPVWIAIPAMVLLGGAAIGGMSRGWFVGFQSPARAAAPTSRGFVGSRISVGGTVFTVLDDSAVRDAAGRRASVIARDAAGRAGLLFVGFDAAGAVVEASTLHSGWAPASVIA